MTESETGFGVGFGARFAVADDETDAAANDDAADEEET